MTSQQGRPAGWSHSTVRAVLDRSLYRGEMVYGRTRKVYGRELRKVRRGTVREFGQVPRPEAEWVRVQVPALRIVDVETVARVDQRRKDRRTRYLASLRGPVRQPEKAHGKYLLSGGLLVCPTCDAHFEAVKSPWKRDGVYLCSTRRRKPGMCNNTVALSIQETDEAILSEIEGEVLGTRYIDELLALVDSAPDPTAHLQAERDRLWRERDNLLESIAAGVPAATVAPKIADRERAIAAVVAQLAAPRPRAVDRERLRTALLQRTETWKQQLRDEPKVARMLLRRLVGPLVLHTPPPPEIVLNGRQRLSQKRVTEGLYNWVASPTGFGIQRISLSTIGRRPPRWTRHQHEQ